MKFALLIFVFLPWKVSSKIKYNTLPTPGWFTSDLFIRYGSNSSHMTRTDFKSLVNALQLIAKHGASTDDDGHEEHDRKRRSFQINRCYGAEDLLNIFNVTNGSSINFSKFQEISPSLIQQIQCNTKTIPVSDGDGKKYEDWQPWLATMVTICVISTASLAGTFIAPFAKRPWFPFLIMFLISLAVAVLIGDAMLHLFPHSLDIHQHREEGATGNAALEQDSFLWKSTLFLFGVFLFFSFEVVMHAFGGGHSHSHDGGGEFPEIRPRAITLQQENFKGVIEMNDIAVGIKRQRRESIIIPQASGMLKYVEQPIEESKEEVLKNDKSTSVSASHSKQDLVVTEKFLSIKNFKSVVWMVFVGDAIHNFMDGVAIGVAFSEEWPSGLNGGISTSIAIFCHELPHELGDFAVLLASGLSIKQAILMNFLSSLCALLGGVLGVSLGTQWQAAPWIFATTAGLFVYIALADMLPEALNSSKVKSNPLKSTIVLEIGLLVGFVFMFFLAAYEDVLKKAFG